MDKDKLPSEMDPKDLPDGRAFEDEFTRGLIQSTEEVSPGYYPFKAKNGKYEMTFPRNGLTNDLDYTSENDFESFIFTDWEEGEDTAASVNVSFYSYYKPGNIEAKQGSLQSNIGVTLEFEVVPGDNQTYYVAPFEKKIEGESNLLKYGYAAYIQKESEAGGIYVIYSFYCSEDCEERKEVELEEAYDWIQTIQFVDDREDDAS